MQAISKFYTATCQAKELAAEAKTAKDKTKELNNEILLKKGEVLRLTKDYNRLQGSEAKLKNEVEELKADNLEKDSRIVHLKGQVVEFTSSLEKAREEFIAAFKRSDEYKNRLDSHYAASYEDFRADAKEAYPDLDFSSFKLPLATESSLLQTSSEDVNIMDDANTEVNQDNPKTSSPKWQPLENLFYFYSFLFLKVPSVLGFVLLAFFFQVLVSTIVSSKIMDEAYIQ